MVRSVGRCALLAFSLYACGGDDDEAPDGDGGGECLEAGDCARVDGTAGEGVTHGFAVAVAPDGDVLVAGLMSGTVTFGAGGPNETTIFAGSNDIFVARYDDCGLVWVTRLLTRGVGGNPALASAGVVLDDGSFAVVGQFTGEVVFAPEANRQETLEAEGSQSEAFVLLVNPEGQPAWIARSTGIGADTASGITAVAGGTVAITGSYGSSDAGGPIFMTLGEGETNETTLESTEGTMQVFVALYDGAGHLVWARRAVSAGTSDSFARAATTADNGDVVIGGTSLGSSITFAPGEPEETVLDGAGSFLARYSAGGTLRWAMPSTVAGSVTAVTSLLDGGFAVAAVTTSEARIAGHDADGNGTWLEEIRPRSAALDEPIPSGLATLEDGTLLVTGVFAGGALFGIDGPEQTELDATGTTDAFVAAYDPAGTLVWAERAGGGDDDRGASIAATPDGGLVWTGQLSDDATFFADSCSTPASGPDHLLVRAHP